jgi:hypothetical protein
MMSNATTSSEIPSPVDLSTLSVHRSTGLAFPGRFAVLCTIGRPKWAVAGAIEPDPLPFPSAPFARPTPIKAAGAESTRRPAHAAMSSGRSAPRPSAADASFRISATHAPMSSNARIRLFGDGM